MLICKLVQSVSVALLVVFLPLYQRIFAGMDEETEAQTDRLMDDY